jgi:hypothetical protein
MYPNQIVIAFYLCVMSVFYIFRLLCFTLTCSNEQLEHFLLILLILEHILYPVVCEILFSNLYLDLIEFEINYNYNFICCRVKEGWWEQLRESLFRETPQSPSPLCIVLETTECKNWPRCFEKLMEYLCRHKIVVVKFSKISVRDAAKWTCPVEFQF